MPPGNVRWERVYRVEKTPRKLKDNGEPLAPEPGPISHGGGWVVSQGDDKPQAQKKALGLSPEQLEKVAGQ